MNQPSTLFELGAPIVEARLTFDVMASGLPALRRPTLYAALRTAARLRLLGRADAHVHIGARKHVGARK